MDKDQTILQIPLMEVDQVGLSISPTEARENLNFLEGKNVPTTFLSLGPKLGGENTKKKDIDIELDKMDDTSGDENPYRELIINNAGKIEITLSQMEQWSILSNVINYVQYDRNPKDIHTISVRPINKTKNKVKSKKGEREKPIS